MKNYRDGGGVREREKEINKGQCMESEYNTDAKYKAFKKTFPTFDL